MDNANMRHGILGADDLPVSEKIPTPEWSPIDEVYVRTVGADEHAKITAMADHDNALGEFGVLVMCNSNGVRIFADGDAEALGHKNPAALQRIADAGTKHNGMSQEERDKTAKNSQTTPGDDSSSSSPRS